MNNTTTNNKKPRMRYHLTPVGMAIINKSTHNKYWWGCGERQTLLHCWWECRLVQPLWKTVWRYLKKFKMDLPLDPAVPLLEIYLKEPKTLIWKNMSTSMFIAALFAITKIWSSPTVHQQMSGKTTMGYLHNGMLLGHRKRRKFYPLKQYGRTWRVLY